MVFLTRNHAVYLNSKRKVESLVVVRPYNLVINCSHFTFSTRNISWHEIFDRYWNDRCVMWCWLCLL